MQEIFPLLHLSHWGLSVAIVVYAKALGSRVPVFNTSGAQRIKKYQQFTFGMTRGIAAVPIICKLNPLKATL